MNAGSGLHILILQSAQGDSGAKAELAEMIRLPLTRYLFEHFSSSLDEEDVHEIINQSILLIYLYANTYRGQHQDASAWGWATKIARSQALKWIKVQKRIDRFPDSDDDDNPDNDGEGQLDALFFRAQAAFVTESVEDQALEQVLLDQVIKFIHTLSMRERLIIYWHYALEMTQDEIAQRIHVTKSRVNQILKTFQTRCRGVVG